MKKGGKCFKLGRLIKKDVIHLSRACDDEDSNLTPLYIAFRCSNTQLQRTAANSFVTNTL